MTNFIGRRPIIDYQSIAASNVAGIWSLDDISFMRGYNYIRDSSSNYIVERLTGSVVWTCPTGVSSVDYLVVAGGGSGGGGNPVIPYGGGGGGGAGAFGRFRQFPRPRFLWAAPQ